MSAGAAGAISRLRPVPLQELRLRADALLWPVDQKLAELDSLTPVRGQIRARHHGSVLEVEGEAETIVTLCCDRCLQHFNRPLRADVHELLELAGGDPLEGSDLTALAASAAGAGAPRARLRAPGPGAGASGASAPGGRAAGRPPAPGRDRSRREVAAGGDLSPSRSSGQGTGSGLAANAGSQPRSRARARGQAEPLLIEAIDDRLDPRGDFDPERWLFEQLSLQLPVVNRCGADCPGPPQAAVAAITSQADAGPPAVPRGQADQPEDAPSAAAAGPGPRANGHADDHSGGNTQASASRPAATTPVGSARVQGGNAQSPPREPEPAIDPRWAALRQLLP